MNQYKMICLDIDGTLLNSEHKITPSTKEIIEIVANNKQIPVILVSARMPKGILFLQKELNIVQPIICYSGALIVDGKSNILLNITIPISEVKQIYKLVKELNIHISLYKDNEWYVESMDAWAKQESEITNITPNIISFEELIHIWDQDNTGPNKILCMAEPCDIKLLNSKVANIDFRNLNVYPSKDTYLEIMPISATKTSAIEFLCKKLHIRQSEVMAIGDNYNDINMIEFAGMGIAMGNSPGQVKECADFVTLTNDENGVVHALRKYILE